MSIQKVVDYWNKRPCNIKHSKKEIGTKEYFEEVSNKKYKVEPHILEFADFEKWKNKKVLEIGCGIGTAMISFIKNGAIYTGLDLTSKAIDLGKKRLDVYNLKGELMVCNAEDNLPEDKFDLVYSFGVIHHSPNPKKIIENAYKVLNKGGELRIMLYSKWSYKLFWILHEYENTNWEFGEEMDKNISNFSEAQTGCPIAFTYTFDEIEELLKPYFKIEKIWKDHIFPYKIKEYKEGKYEIVDEFKNMNKDKFRSMEKELGWHTLVKAVKV